MRDFLKAYSWKWYMSLFLLVRSIHLTLSRCQDPEMKFSRKSQWRSYRKIGKHLENFCQNSLNVTTLVFPFKMSLRQKYLFSSWWWHSFCPCSAICHVYCSLLSAYLLPSGDYELLEKKGYVSFIFLSPAIIIISNIL